MGNNITDRFIEDLFDITRFVYSESVILQAKRCLLDYLGATFAGAAMLKEKGERFINCFGSSQSNATAIGFNRKTDIKTAALMNGISAHIAELDDGERFGMLHPGAPVISALLPLAEVEKLNSQNLLKGIITGYEAAIRMARALQPSLKDRGYHATGVCGTIGSAMGLAATLNFTKSQMKNTLSAAATGASGILKVIEEGSELKPLNSGQAALSGLIAAFIARAGFQGPTDILSGERGFLTITSSSCDLTQLKKNKKDPLGIENVYMKPYAACRHCHPPIEAALKIRSDTKVKPEIIKEIKIFTYKWAVALHDHTKIDGVSSAKMSTPYSVAAVLVTGKAGLHEFEIDKTRDIQILSLAQKVKVYSDEKLTSLVPRKRSAIVEITTNDNNLYIEKVDLPKGEPERPLSERELKEKFLSLAIYGGKSKNQANAIIRHIWNLDDDNLNALFPLL